MDCEIKEKRSSEMTEEDQLQEDLIDFQPSVSDDADGENLYINNAAMMGNLFDKSDETEVKVPISTDPSTSMSNCYGERLTEKPNPSMAKVGEHKNKIERPVSPDVRALASQFENKHLQHVVKPVSKGGPNTGKVQVNDAQLRTGSADPFVYCLAKEVSDLPVTGINSCVNFRSLAVPYPDCQQKSMGSQSSGYFSNDPNIPVTLDTENSTPQFSHFNEELSHRLNRRHAESVPSLQDHNTRLKLVVETENTETDLNMVKPYTSDSEVSMEQTIYDSVCEESCRLKGFEVISKDPHELSSKSTSSKSHKSRRSRELLNEGDDYDWKRKEAKRKSRTLKRPLKSEGAFHHHGKFEDPKDGVLPEIDDNHGIMEAFNPFELMEDDSASNISDFTDSSFDLSDSEKSDSELISRDSYSSKPLPPEPLKPKVHFVRDLRQLIYQGDADCDEDKVELEKVNLRRKRQSPALPEAPPGLSQNQIKLRGVLQSLIDSEKNYITSLDRLVKVYRDPIQQQFGIKKSEVVDTFNKVEEIQQIHLMFQIELGEKLSNWTKDEKIGNTFHLFTGNMVLDIYSDYVNKYEAASEFIKDISNTKPAFRDFLKEKQMSSADRLSLPGLMLKPIQRFPQFIMIIKDLLKYTPREHHDRVSLQEALTGMENVAHQLNERKRQSEQYYHGQHILAKFTPRLQCEKKLFLIRQDDVEQLGQDSTDPQNIKQRRLFLMSDKLISVHVSQKELNGGVERFTYKWHQSLSELDLTTSAITPNMQTTVHKDNSTILSPKLDHTSEDPYSLATDITDMVHDINILAQVHLLVSALKLSYPKLNEDLLHEIMTGLQRDIQGVDYQLQLLNSSSIILHDKVRKKKYVFSAANANVKQEWCIDFLLAKYALDIVNIPSWHKQEIVGSHDKSQPALLMKHLSVDMQRTFTRIKCAVPVYFPTRNEGSVEHLWVCCSTESLSQVSIVSLHTARPALVESFQATQSEIVCAETVPGHGYTTAAETPFAEDTVWMSTTDSEILVYVLSDRDSSQHRKPVHVFKQSSIVLRMLYLDDRVFCGNRNGNVIVYSRNDGVEWALILLLMLDNQPIRSIISVQDTLWVACGSTIHIVDAENYSTLDTVGHQQPEDVNFNCLVKAGVGVWASFLGRSNISLYHVETKHHLQDFNIGNAVGDFISVHSGMKESTKNYEVTSLMASLGLLWIGTDIGVVLTYPLPRLRDGVPKINQRPSVALHGHNRAVQFIIPVHYGPVSGSPVKRRPSEILKKNKITPSVLQRLPKLEENERPHSEESHKYLSLDAEAMSRISDSDNLYEPIDNICSPLDKDQRLDDTHEDMEKLYEDLSLPSPRDKVEIPETTVTSDNEKDRKVATGNELNGKVDCSVTGENVTELRESGEHTYFVLEKPEQKKTVEKSTFVTEGGYADMNYSVKKKPSDNKDTVKKKPLDDLDLVTRPKLSAVLDPSMPSFRSELKNKLKHRKSLEDLADRDVNTEEVGRLYETLMRPRNLAAPRLNYQDSISLQHSQNPDGKSEMLYVRPNSLNPIIPQKPNYSSLSKRAPRFDSVKQKRQANKTSVMSEQKSTVTPKHKVGSSFSAGTSTDTLRRQDSNTILVLTGGDGYKDWKKRQSLQSYRPEEPSLVFWLYKF